MGTHEMRAKCVYRMPPAEKNARATKLYFILGQMLEFIPEPLQFLPALATNNLADNKSLLYERV